MSTFSRKFAKFAGPGLVLAAALACSAVRPGSLLGADGEYEEQEEYEEQGEAAEAVAADDYAFAMRLKVPRVYDNAGSRGRRKYQTQRVAGVMSLLYGEGGELVGVEFSGMVNKTHRTSSGARVTYPRTRLDDSVWPRFNVIGSNRTGKFKTASLCFYLAAEPDYNVGGFDEDNALYLMLAGKGTVRLSRRSMTGARGNAAGALGCGCSAYGHLSPTRVLGRWGATGEVDDVAAVWGTWKIRLRARGRRPV